MCFNNGALYLSGAAWLLLVSCNSPESKDAGKLDSHSEPSDWIPQDTLLVKGRTVYMAECAICHDEGEEGAPPLARVEEWTKRAAKGTEVLFDHAINGFNGDDGEMPARGGTETLTDDDVKSAVRYMIAASTKNYQQ